MKKFLTLPLVLVMTQALAQTPTAPNLVDELQEAIGTDDAGKVAFILREKAYDPNLYLPNGETPLVYAIRMDASVTVNQVLLRSYKINVNVPTLRGETPLMLAAIKGDRTLAEKLLEMGAPVNANYGWTALHYAASVGESEMTQFLIDRGAEINARTPRGVTPLYMAARIAAANTVAVLLKAGADKTLCNDQGISPAESARRHGSTVLAKELAIDKCSPWPVSDSENTIKPDASENTTSEAKTLSSSTP